MVLLTGSVFIGMIIGGIIGRIIYIRFSARTDRLYLYCGGLLTGLLAFEIIPESSKEFSLIGLLVGGITALLFMFGVEQQLDIVSQDTGQTHKFRFSFLFFVLAISIHNIPTGMAVGTSLHNTGISIHSLYAATFLHHIPEGVTLMISALLVKRSFIVPCILLAIVFYVSLNVGSMMVDDNASALLMGSAIGSLAYVSFYEMIWKTRDRATKFEVVGYSVLGLCSIWGYLFLVSLKG